MAVSQGTKSISIPASGDLSASQFRIVDVDANGRATIATGTTDVVLGILCNKPAALNQAAEVVISGIAKMTAGVAVNEGDYITAVAGGRGSATTTDATTYVGIALTAAAGSGDLFEVLVGPGRHTG